MICGRTPEELIRDIENFHGFVAPGLLIGAYMVDLAYQRLEKDIEADAIVETRHCQQYAVQIFTRCTIGNGWLKILDFDKFALTLYNRHTLMGSRIWVDLKKTEAFPYIYKWFMGLISKRELPKDILVRDIIKAGHDILSCSSVQVTQHTNREKKGPILVCTQCLEAYSIAQGTPCLACQGKGYYECRSTSGN
ncbi:MAG: FmdE family protein [Desulfobacteraceae bacterium]|jgi:formylmethanofuran dehydrogenase subunit E